VVPLINPDSCCVCVCVGGDQKRIDIKLTLIVCVIVNSPFCET